jgi:pimeloyl-ACP methyl ester carboxylesterase
MLIGHSVGGRVIVAAARRLPEKVVGLVGVETYRNLEQTRTRQWIDERLMPFRANFRDAVRQFVRNNQFVPTSDPDLVETIVEDMAAAPPNVGVGTLDGAWSYDPVLREGLQEVEAPVFLINADYKPTDIEISERFGINVEIVSGVSHFLMIEAPDLFNRRLKEIVEELIL